MNNDEFFENLIPAYALDALDEDERAALEARLAIDPEAQRLLAEYDQIAGNLAFAVPARPAPAHLSADLLRRLAAREVPTTPARPATRMYRYLAVLAALLVLAVGIVVVIQSGKTLTPDRLYAELAARSDSLHFPLQPGEVTDAVIGELVAAPDGLQAVLAVAALPDLSTEQTFQLWLRGVDGSVRSGGLFQAASDGSDSLTYVILPLRGGESVETLRAVGVSLEPAGGSPYADRPTGPRVLAVPINPEA